MSNKRISLDEARAKLRNIEYKEIEIYSDFFEADMIFRQPDASAGMTLQHMILSIQKSDVVSQEQLDQHNRKLKAFEARRKRALETGSKFDQSPPELEGVSETKAQQIDMVDIQISLIIACSVEPNFEESDRELLRKMTFAQVMQLGAPLMELTGFTSDTSKEDEAAFQGESDDAVLTAVGSGDGDAVGADDEGDELAGAADAPERDQPHG